MHFAQYPELTQDSATGSNHFHQELQSYVSSATAFTVVLFYSTL